MDQPAPTFKDELTRTLRDQLIVRQNENIEGLYERIQAAQVFILGITSISEGVLATDKLRTGAEVPAIAEFVKTTREMRTAMAAAARKLVEGLEAEILRQRFAQVELRTATDPHVGSYETEPPMDEDQLAKIREIARFLAAQSNGDRVSTAADVAQEEIRITLAQRARRRLALLPIFRKAA